MGRLWFHCFWLGAFSCLVGQSDAPVQGDQARRLWNREFQSQRAAASADTKPTRHSQPHTLVGVTLWRLRPSRGNDQARLIVHERGNEQSYSSERLRADSRLYENDRIRISIESARSGHLYVASQEKYVDGTTGSPYLIFPSRRIRGGESIVTPGIIVDIPEENNPVPFLRIRRSHPDLVAEVLTIMVAPAPILELMVHDEALPLPVDQVERWKALYGKRVVSAEARESAGKIRTEAEKEAALGNRRLKHSDPLPQTIYQIKHPGEGPAVLSVELTLAR